MARHLIIVSSIHRDLFSDLRERFSGDTNVDVILDRRAAERRARVEARDRDRRQCDRRQRPEVDAELISRSHTVVSLV